MSTECYAMVRGSMLRVTRLNGRGGFADEPIQYVATKAAASVTITTQVEGGSNELLRTDEQVPRLHFVKTASPIRYGADIRFLRVDPSLLSLITGVPVVENYDGDIVGFDANTRLSAKAFALEVWSNLAQRACADELGFGEGGFGMGPFGGGDGRAYGYTLFPFLKGGVLSGFTFANGLVSFDLTRAQTRRNAQWGTGPHAGSTLLTPIGRSTHWRSFMTTATPPEQTDGIVSFTDILEGGTSSATSSDVVDGEFVITSPDIVEGGSAA